MGLKDARIQFCSIYPIVLKLLFIFSNSTSLCFQIMDSILIQNPSALSIIFNQYPTIINKLYKLDLHIIKDKDHA